MGRLERVPVGGRQSHLPLLCLADDAHDHVEAHLDEGEVLVWIPDGGRSVIGAVQAVPRRPAVWEITLVAVLGEHQGNGHGSAMLHATVDWLAERGARRVIVGTASSGVGQLGFYQRAGFRLFAIEHDHFDEARGYDGTETENGIPVRDMVWLDRLL